MIRKLELLIVAVVLVVAAFSTALPFLFYLLYLAILVIGGSYVLVRLGLTDLNAKPSGRLYVRHVKVFALTWGSRFSRCRVYTLSSGSGSRCCPASI